MKFLLILTVAVSFISSGETSDVDTNGSASAPTTAAASAPVDDREVVLSRAVESLIPEDRHFRSRLTEALVTAYRDRGFRSLWEDFVPPRNASRELAEMLEAHGLPRTLALDPTALEARISTDIVDPRDLAYSVAILDAAMFIRMGAVPPESLWPQWNQGDTPGSDDHSVEAIAKKIVVCTVLKPFSIEKILSELSPQNWVYRKLQTAFPEAREAILKYSGLPQLLNPASAGIGRPGEVYPYAAAIAAHLVDKGYLEMAPEVAAQLSQMTPELSAALIAFQKDYGLDPDGVFGPTTWRYLNTNAADRYRSLSINLHRARILPYEMG
ncbi:MAG: peptidoglycan-binding protein, partial [Verrucomicrobiota bacterium]